jgi:DNA-binding NarL/FixJ family response regulator
VKAVSRYLDKSHAPLHAADPGGLLVLACHRSMRRLNRKRGRIELIGGSGDLAEILRAPDWSHDVERRLFLQQLARELSTRTRAILRLRIAGYDWKEIARMLQMNPAAVRNSFWRDVRKAHLRLLRTPAAENYVPRGDER